LDHRVISRFGIGDIAPAGAGTCFHHSGGLLAAARWCPRLLDIEPPALPGAVSFSFPPLRCFSVRFCALANRESTIIVAWLMASVPAIRTADEFEGYSISSPTGGTGTELGQVLSAIFD